MMLSSSAKSINLSFRCPFPLFALIQLQCKIAPNLDGDNASSGEDASAAAAPDAKPTLDSSGIAGTSGPGNGRAGGFGQALAVATAPVHYLFGLLGGVPGWFSDVVFEVGKAWFGCSCRLSVLCARGVNRTGIECFFF